MLAGLAVKPPFILRPAQDERLPCAAVISVCPLPSFPTSPVIYARPVIPAKAGIHALESSHTPGLTGVLDSVLSLSQDAGMTVLGSAGLLVWRAVFGGGVRGNPPNPLLRKGGLLAACAGGYSKSQCIRSW